MVFPIAGPPTRFARPTRASCRARAAGLVAALAFALARPAASQPAAASPAERAWVGTWATSPQRGDTAARARLPARTTLRQVVRVSIGGAAVRVRLSNETGTEPLVIGAARLARLGLGAQTLEDSDRVLSFGGRPSITIAAGARAFSDPVALDVLALSDLALSLYLPKATAPSPFHPVGLQTSYLVPGGGDHTGSVVLPAAKTTQSTFFLGAVDVVAEGPAAAVVAFGDSITDGADSTPDANRRWPNRLAERLHARGEGGAVGVLNAGLSGNRLLSPLGPQHSALSRFDRDVLAQSGVAYVVVLIGINDIGQATLAGGGAVTAGDLIAGLRQLIARSRARRIAVYGATLTPIGGSAYDSARAEALRQTVNQWIRSSGEFDAVIDFDLVTRDPTRPARFLPAFDCGDHLHPSDAGYRAMADAVPLTLFGPKATTGR